MKNSALSFVFLLLFCSCTNNEPDDSSVIIKSIVENEMSHEIRKEGKTFIFFLQNAECKCSEETLDRIRAFDETKGKLIIVVNKRSHFSVPKLQAKQESLKYISINTLLSYGFFQDKDMLVELDGNKLIYTNL
ncbi:hypothetical protein [Roseivirga sp. E12]|uniref:hypothetical protein n=1 Tax=Roseivirga sp. E12 TaxID=2819237 RepID=UPI001ABCCCC6|nr:hypothetical protein [Roseivirga sp. E12]MBO3699873.1 hypothetical protein [Roseivirga sp. E12]